jgi:FtsH-binding integral membrane protein
MIAEFALVMGISFGMRRMSANMAMGLFMVYAVLNGFTLSVVLLAFSGGHGCDRLPVYRRHVRGNVHLRLDGQG